MPLLIATVLTILTFSPIVSAQTLSNSSSCPALTRTLQKGGRGTDVAQLQNFLIAKGYLENGNNTGYFGSLTEAAVQKFQCAQSVVCSGNPSSTGYGLVGAKTRATIQRSCSGSTTTSTTNTTTNSSSSLIDQLAAQIRQLQERIAALKSGNAASTGSGTQSSGATQSVQSTQTSQSTQSSQTTQTTTTANTTCTFNNQTVAHGQSVTAYQSSSVSAGQTCQSQTRTCSNGTLSGSYSVSSCAVESANTQAALSVSLSANQTSITAGTYATLSFQVSGATSCTLTGGAYSPGQSLSNPSTWSGWTGILSSNTTFTLTCTNAQGTSQSKSVTVAVTQPAPSVSFSASPTSVTKGTASTLYLTTANVSSCTISGGAYGSGQSSTDVASWSGWTGTLNETTTFSATCVGTDGSTQVRTLTVAVTQSAPSVSFSASPASVTKGTASTLYLTTSNVSSCTISGGAYGSGQSSSNVASWSGWTGTLNDTTTFTATCFGTDGSTQTKTVTVSATEQKGVAFSYAVWTGSTYRISVGHAVLGAGGSAGVYAYTGYQSNAVYISSGVAGFCNASSQRGGVILKPNLSPAQSSTSYSSDVNSITLSVNGDTLVFYRSSGTRNLTLASVNGYSYPLATGFGYETEGNPRLTTPITTSLGGGLYSTDSYLHKRGSESWMALSLGVYPLPYASGNASGEGYTGSDGAYLYNSFLVDTDSNNYGIVFQHQGHDYAGTGCNNSDGHTSILYGFGENNTLRGFMALELSADTRGAYISVARFLRQGMNH